MPSTHPFALVPSVINFATFSMAGRKGENQDAILAPRNIAGYWLTAIADGVGGAAGGAVASGLAIAAVDNTVTRSPFVDLPTLFDQVRADLAERAQVDPSLAKMATTLTVCRIRDNRCEIGHVGDTRLYHLRGGGIQTRTRDQTEAQELVDAGVLKPDEVRRYARRNVLLSSISPNREYSLFQTEFYVTTGDIVILTTDGVHGLIQRRELRDLAVASGSSQSLVSSIRQEIERRGPIDDYSSVVMYL